MKKIIISSIFIFITSSLLHFIYEWFPNTLTSLFFPINESIWEHNKIIVGSYFILAIIEKIFFYKNKNIIFQEAISSIICGLLVLIIFTPIYLYILNTKNNIFITFIIYIFSIIISQIISYHLLKKEHNHKLELIGILLFIIYISINILFTFYQPKLPLFYDYNHKIYGIK